MKDSKNSKILWVVGIILIALGISLLFFRSETKAPVVPEMPEQNNKHSIAWKFSDEGENSMGTLRTKVTLIFDQKEYDAGTYDGSCSEIDERGGIDGTGLLPNEVAGVQCWFAGGGSEIGVFKYDDLYIVNLGILEEGDAETPPFRGTFEGLLDLP